MSQVKLGSLCSGYGGLDMAVARVLGGTPAWSADNDTAAAAVLGHHYPDVPNLGDITAVDWATVEPVQVLTAGFPCQDVSTAGKRAGLRPGTRSGLWSSVAYAISRLRPELVVIENVPGLLSANAHSDLEPCPWCMGDGDDIVALRALGAVLGDLASLGFDAEWASVPAAGVGCCHLRWRVFIVARPVDNTQGHGRHEGRPEPTGQQRGPDAAFRGDPTAADPDSYGRSVLQRVESSVEPWGDFDGCGSVDWGIYTAAVRRWERLFGRAAPGPTILGARGGLKLSAYFVEWMQGLPEGHVTNVPGLSINDMLHLLGNGVVPRQAEAALRWLLPLLFETEAVAA